MVQFIIPFQVGIESIQLVKSVIEKFIKEVHTREPGTLFYKSFQYAADETCFTHIMTFKDEEAHELHRSSNHLKVFVETLYPLCITPPKNIKVNEIAS